MPGRVSVVVPVRNDARLVAACLAALTSAPRHPDDEIVVVDDGAGAATRRTLERFAEFVTILRNEESRGFAVACNQGAARARGELLLFLNDDTEVRPGWMEPLVEALRGDPGAAAAGSRLLYPDGRIQHAGVELVDDRRRGDPLLARNLHRGEPGDLPEAHRRRLASALTAACLLVRARCFREVGGFHEGFRNGYEDVDLCLQLRERGWRLVYEPRSTVVHHEAQSGPERFAHVEQNVALLHRRWLGRVRPDRVLEAGSRTGPVELSIVIPAYDRVEYTLACLCSIARSTPERYEIIVVDNGSTDGTSERLRALRGLPITVLENDANRGFAPACNQGIRAAAGRYVVLLNNDALVTPGWSSGLVRAVEREARTGMAGPRTNYACSGFQLDRSVGYRDRASLEAHAARRRREHRGVVREAFRLLFFCVLVKRRLFEEIGLLDEGFGIGNYEDDDLCWRARQAGWKLSVAEEAFVHHFGHKTFQAHPEVLDHDACMRINGSRFFEKHGVDPGWYASRIDRVPIERLVSTELADFEVV